MIDAKDINRRVDAVQKLLAAKFGIRHRPLGRMVKRAGGRLPKAIRRDAQVLMDAQARAGNPKLARQLDQAALTRAHTNVVAHLKAIDLDEQRKDWWLKLAGVIAFHLLVIVVCFVYWMWWRGYV